MDASGNCYVAGYYGSPTITFDSDTLTNAGSLNIFVVSIRAAFTDIPHHFFPGWNLISISQAVSDYTRASLYPFATSPAFSFENNGYTIRDTLMSGLGYWLKFPYDTTFSLPREAVGADTFDVQEGWNLIGSVGGSVSMDSIVEVPPGIVTSRYFGYLETYVPETTIEPGRGYWVKSNAAGKLILKLSAQAPRALRGERQYPELEAMNDLSRRGLPVPGT